MAQKHVVSLGFNFPAADILHIEKEDIDSNKSFGDADIIVLKPDIVDFYPQSSFKHLEKYLIKSSYSFECLENIEHWKQELNLALKNGKTIFVFLSKLENFYIEVRDDYSIDNYKNIIN